MYKLVACVCIYMYGSACLVAQSSPTLYDPMDCSPPGSSVRGILQALQYSCLENPMDGEAW